MKLELTAFLVILANLSCLFVFWRHQCRVAARQTIHYSSGKSSSIATSRAFVIAPCLFFKLCWYSSWSSIILNRCRASTMFVCWQLNDSWSCWNFRGVVQWMTVAVDMVGLSMLVLSVHQGMPLWVTGSRCLSIYVTLELWSKGFFQLRNQLGVL